MAGFTALSIWLRDRKPAHFPRSGMVSSYERQDERDVSLGRQGRGGGFAALRCIASCRSRPGGRDSRSPGLDRSMDAVSSGRLPYFVVKCRNLARGLATDADGLSDHRAQQASTWSRSVGIGLSLSRKAREFSHGSTSLIGCANWMTRWAGRRCRRRAGLTQLALLDCVHYLRDAGGSDRVTWLVREWAAEINPNRLPRLAAYYDKATVCGLRDLQVCTGHTRQADVLRTFVKISKQSYRHRLF